MTKKGEKLGPFSRAERREILDLLEAIEPSASEMKTRKTVGFASAKTTLDLARIYAEPPKVSVADLIRWHIEARGGTEIAEKENAKTVFNALDFTKVNALDFTKDYVKILKTMFPNE